MSARAKREPRAITITEIEDDFDLTNASYWFGGTWCPAVDHRGAGYAIRVVKSLTISGANRNFTYNYFELDAEGLITVAPRGFARDYKPGRVVDIKAAVERYAAPRPDALRIGGNW